MTNIYKQHDWDEAFNYYMIFAQKRSILWSQIHTQEIVWERLSGTTKNQQDLVNRLTWSSLLMSMGQNGKDRERNNKQSQTEGKMDQGYLAKASAFKWRGAAALRCLGYGCFFKQISQWEAVMVGQTKDHVTVFQQKRRHGGQGLLTQRKAAQLFSPVSHLAQ